MSDSHLLPEAVRAGGLPLEKGSGAASIYAGASKLPKFIPELSDLGITNHQGQQSFQTLCDH